MPVERFVAEFKDNRGMEEWKRTTFLDTATGTVYVPAFLADHSDTAVLFMLSFEGLGYVSEGGHLYAPADWITRLCPATAEAVARAVQHTREANARPEGA